MVSILLRRLQATGKLAYKTAYMNNRNQCITRSVDTSRNLVTCQNYFGTWRSPLLRSAVDHEATYELAKKKGVIPDEKVQAASDDPMATWEEAKAQTRQDDVKTNDHEGPVYEKDQDEKVQERSRIAETSTD